MGYSGKYDIGYLGKHEYERMAHEAALKILERIPEKHLIDGIYGTTSKERIVDECCKIYENAFHKVIKTF